MLTDDAINGIKVGVGVSFWLCLCLAASGMIDKNPIEVALAISGAILCYKAWNTLGSMVKWPKNR